MTVRQGRRFDQTLRYLPFFNLVMSGAVILLFAILLTGEQDRNTRIEATADRTRTVALENNRLVGAVALDQLRNCVRANINSAIIQISVRTPDGDTPERAMRFARLADRLYPILDCKQSQLSRRSVRLSGRQTDRYVALVLNARFPIVKDGRVVGSRPSLLEGVDSLEQAGSTP